MDIRKLIVVFFIVIGLFWLRNLQKNSSKNAKNFEDIVPPAQTSASPAEPLNSTTSRSIIRPDKIEQLRSHFAIESSLNIIKISAPRNDNGYELNFAYQPIDSGCHTGDIDLIENNLRKGSSLIWVWEDERGEPIASPRVVSTENMKTPFRDKIVLPFKGKNRYYRYSLCTSAALKSCYNTQAVDYSALELGDETPDVSAATFFSQSFRADGDGIKIFDSREYKNKQKYFDYIKSDESADNIKDFILRMISLQSNNASLPVRIKNGAVEINLSMRTSKRCR